MIVLPHCKPIEVTKHEVLIGRLSKNHPVYFNVVANYKKRKAGYEGEKSIDFYLNLLPEKDYYIFHGLRLYYNGYYFQIDTLILTLRYALLLEVKNLKGDQEIDRDFNQMKRNNKRVKNPVAQVKVQAIKFKNWLQKHHFYGLPVQYLFVNSNENASIKCENEESKRYMCNSEMLIDKITQYDQFYKKEKLDIKEMQKLNRLLLSKHTPKNLDILQTYNLTPKEIITGVKCPTCHTLAMIYKKGKWICSSCGHKSKTAHIEAINDYILLIKPSITNSELRRFLHIDSPDIAQKILHSLNLPSTGKFRDRVYHFP